MWPTVSVILRQVYWVQQIWKKGARNSHKAKKVFRKVLLTNNFMLPSMVNSLTTSATSVAVAAIALGIATTEPLLLLKLRTPSLAL
jgi:hypothetical protein